MKWRTLFQKPLNLQSLTPLFSTVDTSLIGLGAILFQPNTGNKMQVISYNSPTLTTQEQKFSTYDRELYAITFALSLSLQKKIYHHWLYIPNHCLHRSQSYSLLLYPWRKSSTKAIKSPNPITKFSNLQITPTAGTNLTVADLHGRDFATIT